MDNIVEKTEVKTSNYGNWTSDWKIDALRVAKHSLESHKSRLNLYLSIAIENKAAWMYFGVMLSDLHQVLRLGYSTRELPILDAIYLRLKAPLTKLKIEIDRHIGGFQPYIKEATKLLDSEILRFPSKYNGRTV